MKIYYNLGHLFEDVVAIHSNELALVTENINYSFAEINRIANAYAAYLLGQNLDKGDVIALINTKNSLSYALMLGAVKLGIAYVNLDIDGTAIRNRRILEICRPKIVFYDNQDFETKMSDFDYNIHFEWLNPTIVDSKLESNHYEQITNKMRLVDGSTISYIMFTSGSTGSPKGVAITHQNVLHFINWGKDYFNILPSDNFANLSPMYFDNSVFDFYVGLFSGASITPIKKDLLIRPLDLVNYVSQKKCSIWFSVPSLLIYLNTMKVMKSAELNSLRHIIFGGEGYPKTELKKLYDEFLQQARLTNVYGPTECTCICSAYQISDSDFESLEGFPSLGTLNPNFDYELIKNAEEVTEIGELGLIGPNVGAGYFNDVPQSEQKFITLKTPTSFMKKMYLTGDLVKKCGENFYFVGRKDYQIKHMGYRIELEEIEHVLMKINGIYQAAVIYKREKTAYGKLIAYIATFKGSLSEISVIEELKQYLPHYMIPSKIFLQEILPKNPNGKIDKKKLEEISI